MSIQFAHVELRKVTDSNFKFETIGCDLSLTIKNEHDQECLKFTKENKFIHGIILSEAADCCRGFENSAVLYIRKNSLENCAHTYILSFVSVKELINFLEVIRTKLRKAGLDCGRSTFDERTDSWSAVQYFQFYSYLSQQQNMMQDYIRTSTYQKAVLSNASTDFAGKIVLDVGAGSGILSFFAIQAGAKRVYAVEASNMAAHCNTLVQSNKLAGRIVVVSGKIEDIVLPEPVDVIISEPMGYMLYNERMLETYVHARKFLAKKHRLQPMHKLSSSNQLNSNCSLDDAPMQEDDKSTTKEEEDDDFAAEPKPGVMFPSVAQLYVVPFSDEALFAEQHTKANFWYQQSFHGMDLSSLRTAAITEYFNQPVVDTFDIGICPAVPCVHRVDFRTVKESELAEINIPLRFHINQCSTIHGLAFWFDVGFLGSQREVWLSTSPTEPLTHWYQVRCLLGTTLFLQEGQILTGTVKMKANTRQSYDVDIELIIPGSDTKICNKLDLKNPHFRYTGFQPAPPPGSHTKPPTEAYYTNCQSVSVDGQQSVIAASVSGVPNQMENIHQYNGSAYIQQGGTPHMFSAGNVAVSTVNNASMMDSGLQVVQDHQSLPLLSPEYVSVATGNAFNSSRHSLCTSTLLPNDGIRSYLNMNPAAMLSGAGDLITNGWPSEHQYLLNQTAVSQPCHFPTRQYPLSDINMARPGS